MLSQSLKINLNYIADYAGTLKFSVVKLGKLFSYGSACSSYVERIRKVLPYNIGIFM